jgi:sterol desaturase/sphingolipid hydroxylase (fatty acid hydroxylase superfamily)
MVAIFITALISFLVSSLFGYVVHRSLHQPWSGRLNKKHMTHHLSLYPPTDYLSDKYREPGKDNTVFVFAAFAVPVVATPIILGVLHILPLVLVITSIAVMAIMSFLHDYLHDAFHIRHHFLTKIPVFRQLFARWGRLHYLHHVNMQTNFGIFTFFLDKVFGTFWDAE